MPIEPFNQVLESDFLNPGRQKINTALEVLRLASNAVESQVGSLEPSDISTLLVGGKINPVYLDEFVTSVTASGVSVVDAGGNFTATNLEDILVELFNSISSPSSGSTWYTGSVAPATGLGEVGDFYLRGTTGEFYEKTAGATWTYRGNLRGPTGLPGADGADGADGAPGAPGVDGADGADGVGLPAGGATGYIPEKIDSSDYNVQWVIPDTKTVKRSGGLWPASRPVALTVYAVGTAPEPVWLTAEDFFFQEV